MNARVLPESLLFYVFHNYVSDYVCAYIFELEILTEGQDQEDPWYGCGGKQLEFGIKSYTIFCILCTGQIPSPHVWDRL